MNVVLRTRYALVRIGKALPFLICFLALVSYTETLFALATSDFVSWGGYVIPNTPISWLVGDYFEYNVQTLVVVVVISIAIETCIWNKLACAYLGVNLWEKAYFASVDIYIEYVYMVAVANIIVSALLVYKGVKLVTR